MPISDDKLYIPNCSQLTILGNILTTIQFKSELFWTEWRTTDFILKQPILGRHIINKLWPNWRRTFDSGHLLTKQKSLPDSKNLFVNKIERYTRT